MPRTRCPHCNWQTEIDDAKLCESMACGGCHKPFIAMDLAKFPDKPAPAKPPGDPAAQFALSKKGRYRPLPTIWQLLFGRPGAMIWVPLVFSILILAAASDASRGATGGRQRAIGVLLLIVVNIVGPTLSILIAILLTVAGILAFTVYAIKAMTPKR
jgi:hypothetical protein